MGSGARFQQNKLLAHRTPDANNARRVQLLRDGLIRNDNHPERELLRPVRATTMLGTKKLDPFSAIPSLRA